MDHAATGKTDRGGKKTYVVTDPNTTVYVGQHSDVENNFTGHGHFYLVYNKAGLPERLAHMSELYHSKANSNPEVWDPYQRPITTRGI